LAIIQVEDRVPPRFVCLNVVAWRQEDAKLSGVAEYSTREWVNPQVAYNGSFIG
jgi:hypothetical protein